MGLWTFSLEDGTRAPLIEAPGVQAYAQFSPDGRFIAYTSDEHGVPHVYVQPHPPSGAFWQVSLEGGTMPRSRGDGNELFYRRVDGTLMAVPITVRAGAGGGSASIVHGAPEPLFDAVPVMGLYRFTYQPASNGQRFLVAATIAGRAPPITVFLNWQASASN
jgi:hypothetical protein